MNISNTIYMEIVMILFMLWSLEFISFFFFFFNDTATTEIYTLSLHDALPICDARRSARGPGGVPRLLRPLVFRAGASRQGPDRQGPQAVAGARASVREGRRAVVSVQRVRRREGPGGEARERPVHLFRLRHRLPPRQVRARLRPRDRRLGRRPPRLRAAREGSARGFRPGPGQARDCAGAVRRALPQRRESGDGQALGRVRHAARAARGGGERSGALFLRAAQKRPAPRLLSRPRPEPIQRQPAVLRAVRARAGVQRFRADWGVGFSEKPVS